MMVLFSYVIEKSYEEDYYIYILIQRAAGWWEAVERIDGTGLGAAAPNSGRQVQKSRRRRNPTVI